MKAGKRHALPWHKMSSSPPLLSSPLPLPAGFGDADQHAVRMDGIRGVKDASSILAEGISSPGLTSTGDNNFSGNVIGISHSLAVPPPPPPMPLDFGASPSTGVSDSPLADPDDVFAEWRQRVGEMHDVGAVSANDMEASIEALGKDSLYEACDGMTHNIQHLSGSSIAASQNTNAGRQKRNIVYCTHISGLYVGCQNELPALQGHGHGGLEKVTKCMNQSCSFYNVKQILMDRINFCACVHFSVVITNAKIADRARKQLMEFRIGQCAPSQRSKRLTMF